MAARSLSSPATTMLVSTANGVDATPSRRIAPGTTTLARDIFLEGDVHALALDVQPQTAEEAHVHVRDPHEREAADCIAPPVVVDEREARHQQEADRHPVAEAVLAREDVEELPRRQRVGGAAAGRAVVTELL